MNALYDSIGANYAIQRQPDPRIARAVLDALGDAPTVLNVGAGTGSYEPSDRLVVAVEPSPTMIRQRKPIAAPAVQATASRLPFASDAVDASLAILTIHHWPDPVAGLREMRRVSRGRVVILTWDPDGPPFWLADYFPEIATIDRRIFPALDQYKQVLGSTSVADVAIPHDCNDGFLGAYWRRPEAYLNPDIRGAMSTFAKLGDVESGLERLRRDLRSGAWHARQRSILQRPDLDLGYRLVVA